MERPNYWRATVSGLIATYIMSVCAYWLVAIHLPPSDPARLMAFSLGKTTYWMGLAAHYANGAILGLMYARWREWVPGENPWMKGVCVGVVTTVAAQVVGGLVGPLGFFWNRPAAIRGLLTSLIAHLVFGLALAVAYAREEEV
ncbi:MAG: hypothetical protein HYZ11_12615 [Candidatus Tectomicrobia bacterium]|uniref:Uncharacterized protein n=1 Tax=Tectimicrobiota bacterium TaxID=2528274 RepID=A0A932MN80_UNCTE|nr:hypothetical protein [Candidatus Tectomicrobia bacterium]